MKICRLCNIEKDLSEFYKRNQHKDGFDTRCKDCVNEYARKYYINNDNKYSNKRKEYNNKNKDVLNKKSREQYKLGRYKYLDKRKEYYNENKDIIRVRHSNYDQRNRENIALRKKNYGKTERGKMVRMNNIHKRKSLRLSSTDNTITAKFLQQLANDTKYCIFTGVELTADNRHLDHIIPLSRGGKHSADNVRFISDKANQMKGNKLDEEFELYLCKKYIIEASIIHNEIMKVS